MSPTARRFLSLFRPYLPSLALATLLAMVASAVPGAIVFLVQKVLDDVLIRKDATALALMPFAVAGLYVLNGLLNVSRALVTRRVAFELVERMRNDLFDKYVELGVAWHQATPTGEQVSRLTNDVGNIQYAVSSFVTLVQKPLTLAALIVSAFVMDPLLAAVAVPVLPLVILPIDRFGRRLRQSTARSLTSMASLTALLAEMLSGIRVVQAFNAEDRVRRRFREANHEQYLHQVRAAVAQIVPGPVVEVIAAVGVGAAIYVGGRQVFGGTSEPGHLLGFLVALGLMNDPLKGLSLIASLWQRSTAAAEEVFRVLDLSPEVVDAGSLKLGREPVSVAFEDVSFSYGDALVLQGLTFEARKGEVVAVVGPSGAGKTTLANLVPRFRDPSSGRVLVDGHDLREYRLASLRRGVALVGQETFLFNDSVRANIAFGRPEASDGEVEDAARAANAHDFIGELPAGYETRIDELGMRLSGGQRQRICIARALLADAPILVLDEATSALDSESEGLVQEALERLMARRTVIAIAHRLSTIRKADRILVLDQGQVVEDGRHEELLARGGLYARLYGLQTGGSNEPDWVAQGFGLGGVPQTIDPGVAGAEP
jgi:ATP-binding cassette, subfamily B, bacterial MsbA